MHHGRRRISGFRRERIKEIRDEDESQASHGIAGRSVAGAAYPAAVKDRARSSLLVWNPRKVRFKARVNRLSAYEIPEWFRDAKFGMWAHWGPQSAIEDGDWYARNMYMQGSKQIPLSLRNLWPPLEIRLQGHHSALESREVRSRRTHEDVPQAGRQIFHEHGRPPR